MNARALIAFLRRVLGLCRKELLVILKDPANRALLIVPPILQSVIFGYAASYDLSRAPYALLDQSHSAAAAELIAHVDGSSIFRRVATLHSESGIAPSIDRQQALLVIHIGPRFAQRLHAGRAAPVQVILDARNAMSAGTAAAYLGSIISRFNTVWREHHGGAGPPVSLRMRAWFNPNLDTRWFMLPALIAALSMLQTLTLTALSVARERERGTFDQLLVTPYSPAEIMIGKSVPSILVGLGQSTLILLVAVLWFRIPLAGSLLSLYAGLAIFTIASVGIGLAISALAASMQQAMLYGFVLMMPLMLLSGLATPVANMPRVMQWVSVINPLRYAIDMMQRVYLEGVGLGTLMGDIVPLVIIAAATLPFAAWLFRHRLT